MGLKGFLLTRQIVAKSQPWMDCKPGVMKSRIKTPISYSQIYFQFTGTSENVFEFHEVVQFSFYSHFTKSSFLHSKSCKSFNLLCKLSFPDSFKWLSWSNIRLFTSFHHSCAQEFFSISLLFSKNSFTLYEVIGVKHQIRWQHCSF